VLSISYISFPTSPRTARFYAAYVDEKLDDKTEAETETEPEEPAAIQLHERQWEVYRSRARFRVLVAGRRFGKTHLALAEMLRAARGRGQVILYVGPNDQQAKRVVWDPLKELTRQWWAKPPNETEMRIDLIWGSTIYVTGAFKPDTLRGLGVDFLVIDESASQRPEAWNEVFRAALADRQGRALLIGTPRGRDHFYDHFEYAKTDPDWAAFQFSTEQGGLVKATELAGAARQLDPESFRQEFGGEFTAVGRNRVYYAFERALHVKTVSFDVMRPLVWSLDFNVNPMCMLLMQRVDEVVHVLEEIVIKPEANTPAACDAFLKRGLVYNGQVPYYQRPMALRVYGDASGNQRRTAAAETDWTIIKQFLGVLWKGTFEPSYYTTSANPLVRDRVNCVNSRLRNQQGDTRIVIDPCCIELIKDLEQVTWAADATGAATSEVNKSDRARTHASDALGYYISQVFPLKGKIGEQTVRIM
jgi:hypothetical protein